MLDFLYQVLPAIERALTIDLPDVIITPKGKDPFKRRPLRSEVNIWVFPQTWECTPFATVREASEIATRPEVREAAYTVAVVHEYGVAAIYFAGSFAYLAPVSSDLWADIQASMMRPVRHKSYYGKVPFIDEPKGENDADPKPL